MKKLILALIAMIFLAVGIDARAKKQGDVFVSLTEDKSLPYDKRLHIIDSLLTITPHDYELLKKKWDIGLKSSNFKATSQALSVIYNEMYGTLSTRDQAYVLSSYAQMMMNFGRYDKAVELAVKQLRLEKPDSLLYFNFSAYTTIADVNFKIENHRAADKDIEMLEKMYADLKSKKALDKTGDKVCRDVILICKINRSARQKQWDVVLKQSDQLLASAFDWNDTIVAYGAKANVYRGIGRDDLAEELLTKTLSSTMVPKLNSANLLHLYLTLLFDQQRFGDIERVTNEYLPVIEASSSSKAWYENLLIRAKALSKLKRYEEADSLYQKIIDMEGSINRMTDGFISEDLANYNFEELVNSRNDVNKMLRTTKAWMWVLVVLVVGMAVATIVICKNKQRKIRNLEEKLKSAENEISQNQETQRKLTTLNMQMLNLNELVSSIENTLDQTGTSDGDKINSLSALLRNSDSSNSTWEAFKQYFEGTDGNFMLKLYETHPTLSENEAKVCAYMYLNFTTKEIAILTHRSVRTVETIKYRLHKKLNLGPGESTLEYLRSLAVS